MDGAEDNDAVEITVTAQVPVALYVVLTTEAPGRFSDNAFFMRPPVGGGKAHPQELLFFSFGDFMCKDLDLLKSTIRVEDMAMYQKPPKKRHLLVAVVIPASIHVADARRVFHCLSDVVTPVVFCFLALLHPIGSSSRDGGSGETTRLALHVCMLRQAATMDKPAGADPTHPTHHQAPLRSRPSSSLCSTELL